MESKHHQYCSYGCGQNANHILKNGRYCCSNHYNKCPAIREKNSKGLLKAYSSGKRKVLIPDQPIVNGVRKCTLTLRKRLQEEYSKLLFEDKPHAERRRIMMHEQNNRCAICNLLPVWNGKPIKFHYDHINGLNKDNTRENSRLICPNCHTQTGTYCRTTKLPG